MKFEGSLDDLKQTINGCGFSVDEVREQQYGYQVRTKEGAIMNWYTTTGTLNIQGKQEIKKQFEDAWATYTGTENFETKDSSVEKPATPNAPTNGDAANKRVFVVHGHDTTAREQLELVLHKLGLNPFVLLIPA